MNCDAASVDPSKTNIIATLTGAMDDEMLTWHVARLNRTRRRTIPYGINGTVLVVTRKLAREIALSEQSRRAARQSSVESSQQAKSPG